MAQQIQAEQNTDGGMEKLCYMPDGKKPPVWYDFAAPFGAALASLAILAIGVYLILEPLLLTRICGIVLVLSYGIYAINYFLHFAHSRKLVTQYAAFSEDGLEVRCALWTKRFSLEDIVFTMSYSSASNLTIVAATADDYLTITCSCGYLLVNNGKEILRPFYAINKALMARNAQHINHVRNKRYRRKNVFKVPLFVFESEFDTPRVSKLIDALREKYPLCEPEKSDITEE